jgi:hypothetical protein
MGRRRKPAAGLSASGQGFGPLRGFGLYSAGNQVLMTGSTIIGGTSYALYVTNSGCIEATLNAGGSPLAQRAGNPDNVRRTNHGRCD